MYKISIQSSNPKPIYKSRTLLNKRLYIPGIVIDLNRSIISLFKINCDHAEMQPVNAINSVLLICSEIAFNLNVCNLHRGLFGVCSLSIQLLVHLLIAGYE
jgi:hypothetical protein